MSLCTPEFSSQFLYFTNIYEGLHTGQQYSIFDCTILYSTGRSVLGCKKTKAVIFSPSLCCFRSICVLQRLRLSPDMLTPRSYTTFWKDCSAANLVVSLMRSVGDPSHCMVLLGKELWNDLWCTGTYQFSFIKNWDNSGLRSFRRDFITNSG